MKSVGLFAKIWAGIPGLSIVLFAIVALTSATPLAIVLQSKLNDSLLQLAPGIREPSKVVLVMIDDESLRQYGRWPWSRTLVAELVRSVTGAGATVIGIDILFTEPQNAVADQALRNALQQAPHVVLVDKIGVAPDGPRWFEPLPELLQKNTTVGHSLATLDRDGVCRRFPAIELSPDGLRYAFSLALAQQIDPVGTSFFLNSYRVHQPQGSHAITVVRPTLVPIAYRRRNFERISAATLLQGGRPTSLTGHPVIIGFGPADIGDRMITPLSGELPTPGAEIHAQILESILTATGIHECPAWLPLGLLLAACPLLIVLFRRARRWQAVVVVGSVCAGVYALALAVLLSRSFLVPAGPLLMAVVLAPMLTYSADFLLVENSLAAQLQGLRHWLHPEDKRGAFDSNDLSWKLKALATLQERLGTYYELYRALLESIQDAVAIFDGRGELILKNERFESLLVGWGTEDRSLNTTIKELMQESKAPPEPGQEQEVFVGDKLYSLRISPLLPTSISPLGGTILTLTSLENRQERDRARTEALGFLTHELRTPVASIQQYADLMIHYPNSNVSRAAPETIFRESKRLLALISGYLDVMRVDAGARPLRRSNANINVLIENVFEILQPLASANNMQLTLYTPEGTFARVDEPLLTGAILNLVSNAIKYGSPNSEIGVSCIREGSSIELTVINEGTPIGEQDLAKVFEAYYRAPSSETVPGWGIGLAFVKRIAEKHGGSVQASVQVSRTIVKMIIPDPQEVFAEREAI